MLQTLLGFLYFAVLLGLGSHGLHRLHLVALCLRNRARLARARGAPPVDEASLPHVTVQLPLFNESTVAARLIAACARIDYPHDKFELQVLDDSTDETEALSRAAVELCRAAGVDAVHIHRDDRTGYKAGALEAGLRVAKGELVAIFDADFIPQRDFVRSIVGHFRDPKVGMVQTRWGHLNREVSPLTRVQALMLDGHHMVENRARFGADLFFNFSGTGGMWRRAAIEGAGGWQHDTLTEDLDLSYRAQLAGWKFVYREDVVSPSELPEDLSALRAQQYRWAKGTVQSARKLAGRVFFARSGLALRQRVEAFFHFTPHFAYPLLFVLSLLMPPTLWLIPAADPLTMLLIDLPLCFATTSSIAAFYMHAESAQGRSRWGALACLPLVIALGAGFAPQLSKAVLEGMFQKAGEFVRTPKQGLKKGRYRSHAPLPVVETLLAIVSACGVVASIRGGHYFATPFAVLFTVGYALVAVLVAREQSDRKKHAGADAVVSSSDALAGWAAPSPAMPAPRAQSVSNLAA